MIEYHKSSPSGNETVLDATAVGGIASTHAIEFRSRGCERRSSKFASSTNAEEHVGTNTKKAGPKECAAVVETID